jgi:phytoene desaturase
LKKKVIIIGSGFAGLSAASFMAKAGWQVTVLEKHEQPGGRARKLQLEGFTFDMGPSWYWMPDVFERYFSCFNKKVTDYYQLKRLSPSYRVYWKNEFIDVPDKLEDLKNVFESIEQGSSNKLQQFLNEAAYKYKVGIQKLVFKPGQSVTEFFDMAIIKGVFKLDIFNSMKAHVGKYFKDERLRQLVEFPVLFLGALPENTPALYSLMNYADMVGGTWYPSGGMYSIVEAMYELAKELGVTFCLGENVTEIKVEKGIATKVITENNEWEADVVIGGADYHFIESRLLPVAFRSYAETYWEKREMAPSCLLYYIGLNKKLTGIKHHSLFFDVSFEAHAKEIYTTKRWPREPLFYVSATSVTDNNVAPEGCENLFLLIPVATGLTNDTEELRATYLEKILLRMEAHLKQKIREHIIVKKSFALSDFVHEYNAYKGNAYGLANTLMQTAILKPACRSKKVNNLFYTGQLTVPGPGVPPSLISGEVVAKEVLKHFGK